jgi:O-succinylbenzoic acid--CoA ligase
MLDFKGLTLSGRFYSSEQLQEGWRQLAGDSATAWQRQVFAFCGNWLEGRTQFEVFTSGSTGRAKKILLTRAQMVVSAKLTAQALKLQPGDRALMCLSPRYIAGLMMLVRAMTLALEIDVVTPSANPFVSLKRTRSGKMFDFTALVPLQLQAILQDNDSKHLDGMKAVIVGGGAVSSRLKQMVQLLQCPVYETFGMTETATHIALRNINGSQTVPNFQPLPGVNIGQDASGCLTVEGAITNFERLVTNDVIKLLRDGTFEWLGRFDNMINSGGVKVFPETVEQEISRLDLSSFGITACLVTGLPDARLGQCVVALFEGQVLTEAQRVNLLEQLQKRLQPYNMPRRLFMLPQFVRNKNGKIDRTRTLALRTEQHALG